MSPFSSWVVWNLGLASIPVGLGYGLARLAARSPSERRAMKWSMVAVVAAMWLAFVPNTIYLLTEWRHFLAGIDVAGLGERAREEPKWLLAIAAPACFFLAYSGFGVLTMTLAVRPVEQTMRGRGVGFAKFAAPLFFLMSLGVYLGLVRRFNSWDFLHRPGEVLASAAYAVTTPWLLAAIAVFAAAIWLLYEAMDLWLDGVFKRTRVLIRQRRISRPLAV
jgi:uncharacterized membrane protein